MGILAKKLKEFEKIKNGFLGTGEKIMPQDVPISWLQKLQSEIDAIKLADPDGTNELKAAVSNLVWWEKEMEINPCPGGGLLGTASKAVEKAGKKNPKGVWDILRNGTENEFSALCNCLPDIAGEFDDDEGCKKIISIARNRGTNTAIDAVKFIFPKRFDKFWNETESAEPVGKARTLGQAIRPPL